MKVSIRGKKFIIVFWFSLALLSSIVLLVDFSKAKNEQSQQIAFAPIAVSNPSGTSKPSPTSTASPRPLTFVELNQAYGPCTRAPVVFYHHIQDHKAAVKKNQTALSIDPSSLKAHLQYLQEKGYTTIFPQDIADFFNNGKSLPSKPIMLSFDDVYEDFYTQAYPILSQYNDKATLFLPTGLVGNNDYLTWEQISQVANSGLIYVANHTWSHHSMTDVSAVDREITTADQQLSEHGLNASKIFAFPYGAYSFAAEKKLSSLGYNMAFTTEYGQVLCKQRRFALPRVRVGNSSLAVYGL